MPLLRFVDTIEPNPTVRLDLNDGDVWLAQPTTKFPPPAARRARVATLLADGAHYPASAYDDRTLELQLALFAESDDDAAAEVQKLARELNRPNILQVQPRDLTHPVFFRTERLGLDAITWFAGEPGYLVEVGVPAEPFAYGVAEYLRPPLNSNTGFESALSPWTGSGATVARVDTFAYEGAWALRLTPNGVSADAQAVSEKVTGITAGTRYVASAWVYSPTGYAQVLVAIRWYTAGDVLISTSTGYVTNVPAGAWTYLTNSFPEAPATTAKAEIVVRETGTPAASAVLYADDVQLRLAMVATNNPASGMTIDESDIKGDVEAPLLLREDGQTWLGSSGLIALRSRDTVTSVPLVLQAEAMTLGTDTTTPSNDSTASGSGNNFARVSFATNANMAQRLDTSFHPSTPSTAARGTYRLFVRVRRSSAVGPINVQVRAGGRTSTPTLASIATELTTQWRLMDFGLVQMPSGVDPVESGPSGREIPALGIRIAVDVQRVSGSSNLDIDYILCVPADEYLALIAFGTDASGGLGYILDSHSDLIYAWARRSDIEAVEHTRDLTPLGRLPLLRPGNTNRLFVVSSVRSQDNNALTTAPRFDGWYYPRYLSVRPAST